MGHGGDGCVDARGGRNGGDYGVRIEVAALTWLMVSAPVAAETWEPRFLAYRGGTRSLIVSKDAAQFSVAHYGSHESGKSLQIGCNIVPDKYDHKNLKGYLSVWVGGGPLYGTEMAVFATFDGDKAIDLGRFGYARGQYWGKLSPSFIALAATHNILLLTDGGSNFTFELPLSGAADAISQIECNVLSTS